MKNKWLDWEPEPQIICNVRGIEPAKPAKIGPAAAGMDVPGGILAAFAAGPRTTVPQVSRGRLRHLAGRWLRERCAATPMCMSSLHALGRNFFHWAKVAPDADMEKMFVEELLQQGFTPDETGWVSGLVLTEDLAAALQYERAAYQAHVRPLTAKRRIQ